MHEFDPNAYVKASAHQQEWGARLIAELDLAGDERILDIGCGDGQLTAEIAKRVAHGSIVGIDASPNMVQAARRHARPNLSFHCLDVSEAEFENEFDVIVSNATLHWVLDHDDLLHRVHRALRDDGVFRANFAAEGNCTSLVRVLRNVMEMAPYRNAFAGFQCPWFMPSLDAYRSLLRTVPFRAADAWTEVADRTFADADALIGWIDQPSLVPFRQHLSEALGGRFRDLVVEQMLADTAQSDGTYFETFRRMNVLARK